MKNIIYADNAATTKLSEASMEAMLPWLTAEFGNASQPYSFSRAPKRALQEAREEIAKCINAEPEEIFFTSGGTESDNWALKGVFEGGQGSKHIVTSSIEHHAILKTCEALQSRGARCTYVPVDNMGRVSEDVFRESIHKDTVLVSVMHANNEIGTIQPIKVLAEISHEAGALFHTDAVQTVGHIEVDVKKLDVDMLSASAHKFNGPKGIGFLYKKRATELAPLIDGGSQEYGLRAGTENIALIVGMAAALKENTENLLSNQTRLFAMEKVLIKTLEEARIGFKRNGGPACVPGNMSLSFKDMNGEMLLHRLDLKGIEVATGSACTAGDEALSHVLAAIHLPIEYAGGTIRISFGRMNTLEDAAAVAKAIVSIVKAK